MNQPISEREMGIIVANDKEWREFIIRKLENIEKAQNKFRTNEAILTTKFGLLSFGIAAITSIITALVVKKYGG